MNDNEIMELKAKITDLEAKFARMEKSDRFTFEKNIQMLDGRDFQLGLGNGTKIGTAATQKLGFYGVTPVTQRTAPASLSETGTDSDGTARAAINDIVQALAELGFYA